jgi:L-proline amide hydrolase
MLNPDQWSCHETFTGFILIAMTRSTRLVPFGGHETWVQVTEPDNARPGALPCLSCMAAQEWRTTTCGTSPIWPDETGRTVIHYDQVGCGNSTHLPDAPADFWTPNLFVDEFHTVRHALGIDEYHLLGQSWGGMLGAEIAVRQPFGLASLAICNSPASMELWMAAADELRGQLPPDIQATLNRHEEAGTVFDPEYLAATKEFYRRHVCRVVPTPQDFLDTVAQMEADPTVYHTMNGPTSFTFSAHCAAGPSSTGCTGSPHRRSSSPASSMRPPPPPGSRTSSTSPTSKATCSPIPVTAHTWRSPRSSAPSSPPSSPATMP